MTESNQIEVTDDKTRTWVRVEVEGGAPPASAPAASADAPEEEWNKTFGGSDVNEGYSVQQTKDGGYIITGWTSPSYDELSVWLIKTDSKGKEQWSKTFDRSDLDIGNSVQQTKDGGYIITGWTSSYGPGLYDVWLIKTDSRGNKQWDKTFGGSGTDEGYSVQQTTDGGYIITGYAEYMYGGGGNVLLIKVKGE
jgi:hypothetical protein